MKTKNLLYLFIVLFSVNQTANAQLLLSDHEGNQYEYQRMADGRNWMLENMRATTDRDGNPLHVYWRDSSVGGYDTQEEAAYSVGFSYIREEVLGSSGPSSQRTYSARAQGICPDGWHIPEYVNDRENTISDLNGVITAYGGLLGAWNTDANWDAWKAAMRLVPAGYHVGKFTLDMETLEVINQYGSQMHLMTTGHNGTTHYAILMNISGSHDLWGGYEEARDNTGYCRCVENIQATVEFNNFSVFGVDLTFSEPLQKNYGFGEYIMEGEEQIMVNDICARNFIIKEYESGEIVPINEIFKSEDYKNIQIDVDLDESKIYELILVDSKLRENGVPYGGYTFNGGKPMYFPRDPVGINLLEHINLRVNVVDETLVIEQYANTLNAEVYNVQGMKQLSIESLYGTNYINISQLNAGLYIIQFTDVESNHTLTHKFIKR